MEEERQYLRDSKCDLLELLNYKQEKQSTHRHITIIQLNIKEEDIFKEEKEHDRPPTEEQKIH